MYKRYSLVLLFVAFFAASCGDNGNNPEPEPLVTSSVYVTNEGNFSDSNGSITRYNPEDGSTLKQAFEDENGRPMAGLIQSSDVIGDRVFISANSTDKVEVVNKQTLASEGTIELSQPPTAVEVVDNSAYITTYNYETQNDQVFWADLSTMEEIDDSVEVGNQPRDIVHVGNKLYVSINGGNSIEVIDPETNTVERSITVGTSPTQMVVDSEDRIWVVCNGSVSYDESTEDVSGSVYIIDGQTGEVINSIESQDIAASGYNYRLALNEDAGEAYLLNKGISVIDMNNYTLSDTKLTDRSFNGIGYFAMQERIYVGQSKGYSQSGQALLYNLEGTAVDSFSVGIAPNGFHFVSEN